MLNNISSVVFLDLLPTVEQTLNWEDTLGVKKPPSCNLMAACCSVATPSVPVPELLKQAAMGDETCRDFLSVFLPHASHQAARDFYKIQPEHVDRVLRKVKGRLTKKELNEEDIVFYHCRNLGDNGLCQIYEDRPQFCRDYPANPTAILVKGCGYENWVDECKQVLATLGYEIVDDE